MNYSSSDETHTNECFIIEVKIKRKQIGATMMARLKQVRKLDDILSIEFNDKTWTSYDMNSSLLEVMLCSLDVEK